MWRLVLALVVVSPALAEPALQADFARAPGVGFRCVGDAVVADGVLRTRSQAGWQRSGLEIGPLPLPGATWTLEYDFRPVAFGSQGAEFASASPSTHWYMTYVHPGGGINLHTRQGSEWKARGSSPRIIETGQWYHAQVTLTATSLRYTVKQRGGEKLLWDSGDVAVEDMGKETTPILVDEAPDTAAQTEWDNVTVTTDSAAARTQLQTLAAEAARQQRVREEKLALCKLLRDKGISIIPTPQQAKLTGERIPVKDFKIVGDAGSKQAVATVEMIVRERLDWPCKTGLTVKLVTWPAKRQAPWRNEQGYRLRVGRAGVVIEAQSREGFLYGAQTLCQMVNSNGVLTPAPLPRSAALRSGEGDGDGNGNGGAAPLQGCYAEMIVLRAATEIIKLPPEAEPIGLVAATCSGATAAHAIELAGIEPAGAVVVIGPGPLGLYAAALAFSRGADQVVMIGTARSGRRLDLAETAGCLPVSTGDTELADRLELVRGLTRGVGARAVVDCAGTADTIREALELVAPGGTVTIPGLATPLPGFSFDPYVVSRKQVRLQGVWTSNARHLHQALTIAHSRRYPLDALVTHVLPLEQANEGLRLLRQKQAVKVVLTPE